MAGRMPGQRFLILKADVQDEIRSLLGSGRSAAWLLTYRENMKHAYPFSP